MGISCQNVTVVAVGNLTISSTPPGAAIYIYGNTSDTASGGYGAYGTTSGQTITNIAADPAVPIKLTLAGYADYITTVNVPAGDTGTLNAVFAGSLSISSVLAGAEIFLGLSLGTLVDKGVTTPQTFGGMTAATSGATTTWYYKLTMSEYADVTGSFLATAGTTATVSDVSFLGSASFTSAPSGAEIWIGGINTGFTTPNTVTGLTGSPGYTLKKTGYVDVTGPLTVANDTTTIVPLVTFPGSLYITSVLSGASVYIDGNVGSSGTTPLTVTGFSTGTHHYILKYTGYADTASTPFSISAGTTTTVSDVSFLGSASFTSAPSGATIWIGGTNTGITTPNTVTGLTAGSPGYTLKINGYADTSGSLTVANDATTVVPLVTFAGSISVSSTPSGASVYLDANLTSFGSTPLTLTGVSTGSHNVTLKLATYQDYIATGVSVTGGTTAIVSHTMVLSTGSVLFTSTPAGARIWLGPYLGTKIDQGVNTPNTIATLVPGLYDYSLVLSNYLTLTGTITIYAATQTNETVTFAGSAYITSSPTGAEIYLAQSPDTPIDQFRVTNITFTGATDPSSGATKTWNYRLTKTGYTDKTGSFLATAGQIATVTETMATVADIRAQSMIITPSSPCIEGSCSVGVSVTWINNGESSGMFTPSILIDGGATPFSTPYESQSLAGGGATVTKIFTITGLTAAGSPHGICPNPN